MTWAAATGLLVALGTTATVLDAIGRSRRSTGPAYELTSRRVPIITVASAEEAYRAWKQRGLRGRVLLSLSSRLYFVPPDRIEPITAPGGGPMNPAETIERALDPRNFLLVAMERGVVRDLRHVLPDRVFAEKAVGARTDRGVTREGPRLYAPHFGSPRYVMAIDALTAVQEPVLLFVSASFFSERDAADTWKRLSATALRSDLVVLCRSEDDPEVFPAQRAQLAAFASLLGRPEP